jgi:multiple sugar transport system substrate-binding protein
MSRGRWGGAWEGERAGAGTDGHEHEGGLTRRRAVRAAGMALGAGLLAACGAEGGQSNSGSGASAPAPSTAPVTVTMYSRTNEQEAFTKRVEQFQTQFPKIKLDYTPLPGTYPEVIRTHAAAGTLADVLYLQNLVFEGLAVANGLRPIDDLIKRDKVNLGQWYESAVKGFVLDGKQFGLPARGQIQHCYVYYNKDALARAGVKEPDEKWTLDDFSLAVDKLTNRGEERFGLGMQWGMFAHIVAAARMFGGDFLSPDGKKSLLESPQALQGIQWYWDMWFRRQVALPKAGEPKDFGDGKVAMLGQMLAGQRSEIRTAVKDAFKWDMVLMPKGPTGRLGADLSIAPVTLNSKAKAVDQGWETTRWFTDKDTGIALALQKTGSNTPGARKDVYCDERVVNDPDYPRAMLDRVCKAMDLAPTVAYSVPANYRQAELEQIVKKYSDGFVKNEMAPSAAVMKAFHTDVQALLDQPR